MNYRGYMKAEDRAVLEARDAWQDAASWLRCCESRYAMALTGRRGYGSSRQKAARLAELEDARRDAWRQLV